MSSNCTHELNEGFAYCPECGAKNTSFHEEDYAEYIGGDWAKSKDKTCVAGTALEHRMSIADLAGCGFGEEDPSTFYKYCDFCGVDLTPLWRHLTGKNSPDKRIVQLKAALSSARSAMQAPRLELRRAKEAYKTAKSDYEAYLSAAGVNR